MSGRSREEGNHRPRWCGRDGELQGNSTAQDNSCANGDSWWNGGCWSSWKRGDMEYGQRWGQDAEARWESAAEAQQAAVADSVPAGTTASVQITDTHFNQNYKNVVVPGSEGILSAAESSNRIEGCHTAVAAAGAVAGAVSMPTGECPTREADADREAGNQRMSVALLRMFAPTAAQQAGAVCWRHHAQVQGTVNDALGTRTAFTLEHFRTLPPSKLGCKRHNEALKYFRQYGEANDSIAVSFHCTNPAKMSEIVHEEGMAFHFEGEPIKEWHWSDMVAQLNMESLAVVVEGREMDPDRSRGLVCCRLQKTTRYDHARHNAENESNKTKGIKSVRSEETQYCQWDFVLTRSNGTEIWLHPNYSNTQISCREPEVPGDPNRADADVPTRGLGRSSGQGSFKYYKDKMQKNTLRFKANDKGKGKGKDEGK